MHARICAAVCTVVSLLFIGCPPISAAAQRALNPTVIVLDASGSMLDTDAAGRTRMDAAKDATRGFISESPKDTPLGLVTYGTGTGSSDAEKEAGCQDITVLARPGQKTRGYLEGRGEWAHSPRLHTHG